LSESVVSVLYQQNVNRIIVVDNGSTDDSLKRLESSVQDLKLMVVRNSMNVGFAAGCNIGLRSSRAEHVLFINPDTIMKGDTLERLSAVLSNDTFAGMVGPYLANQDGTEQPGGRRVFPTPRRAFMRAFGLSWLAKMNLSVFSDYLMHREKVPKKPTVVEAISGACMLVKRVALDDVGHWDEGYFLHCEDLDLCMRMKNKNWSIIFVPDAVVMHEWGACSQQRPFFVEWHKHKGMLRFYRKFFLGQYPGVLWVGVVIGVLFRFVLVFSYYSLKLLLTGLEKKSD
jgi:GT2 family glycosyltransferase